MQALKSAGISAWFPLQPVMLHLQCVKPGGPASDLHAPFPEARNRAAVSATLRARA
jgi:hypothetical protein